MAGKKKKWYQTGEFEDGYQFGDIFRTIGNAINGDKEKTNIESVSSNKKEAQTKKSNDTNLDLGKVENGRLSLDPVAQLYGYSSEAERQNYIKENPNLYAVMGGYKYEPSVLSKNYLHLNNEGKRIVQEAQEKDAYLGSIQYKLDKSDALRAQKKRSIDQSLTDREIEAEQRIKWLNGSISIENLDASIKRAKEVNSAVTKFNNGEEIILSERLLLTENGGKNYTGGNTYKAIDFLAVDNPENEKARQMAESARQKQERVETITAEEQAAISNNKTRDYIRKSIVKDKYTLTDDGKQNIENINIIAAASLYNDAVYKKGVDKTLAQMELYTNTGMTKYLQDTINAGNIFLTERAYRLGLSDKRASDVLEEIPESKYEIANNAVAQYFVKNDKKFSKFVQDTTVNLANNAIPMLLGGVSGGASMVATGLSVFGGSYGEAVELAPDAEEWQYWLYAGLNTSVELCMEKHLSGDKNIFANSGSEFSEAMFKTLTKNISNKTLLKSAYVLSNSIGETIEESIQGLLSPVLQQVILGVETTSILSPNRNEQLEAIKNALYDGLVGFASAGITTGLFSGNAAQNLKQKQTIGAYYNKVFNDLNIDVNDVAVYLKEISGGKNMDLYKSAEAVLKGDVSNKTVAEMMLNGFEQSREAQRFVYTKIGEQLNENNRYTADGLIKQYEKLSQNGIKFSKSVTDTYNELVNADENTSKEMFNYLVGKLSATMDAVAPRASVAAEVVKKISSDIKENGLPYSTDFHNDNHSELIEENKEGYNNYIDEDTFVEGLWEDSPNSSKNNVEKSQLESVENIGESGIIDKTVDNDVGVPGVYTDKIVWGIFKNHPVRKFGKGYYGKRIKQRISRVDNYELKINPNNESYYLQHPDGRYVQFENMVDNVLQDGKCVLNKKRSFYHVYDCGYKAQNRVLEQARRQIETANVVGYKVKWLVSDEKAVEQISRFFKENKINITVKFYPE